MRTFEDVSSVFILFPFQNFERFARIFVARQGNSDAAHPSVRKEQLTQYCGKNTAKIQSFGVEIVSTHCGMQIFLRSCFDD